MGGKAYLTKDFVGTTHSECISFGDHSVYLIRRDTDTKVQIIDPKGNICNFPGVEGCDELTAEWGDREIAPKIRYHASFHKDGDGFFMIWTIRPDGRYWMDSWGFGEEDEESVELCAHIDEEGKFTAPFKLYSIGDRYFVQRQGGPEGNAQL